MTFRYGPRTAAPLPPGCKPTGGTWDRSAWPLYFVATGPEQLYQASSLHQNLLVAMNEIEGPSQLEFMRKCIEAPNTRVFIDSGVFWLSTSHAKRHGLSMDQALSMAPASDDSMVNLGPKSCEMIARDLARKLAERYRQSFQVTVDEDGECGATVSASFM